MTKPEMCRFSNHSLFLSIFRFVVFFFFLHLLFRFVKSLSLECYTMSQYAFIIYHIETVNMKYFNVNKCSWPNINLSVCLCTIYMSVGFGSGVCTKLCVCVCVTMLLWWLGSKAFSSTLDLVLQLHQHSGGDGRHGYFCCVLALYFPFGTSFILINDVTGKQFFFSVCVYFAYVGKNNMKQINNQTQGIDWTTCVIHKYRDCNGSLIWLSCHLLMIVSIRFNLPKMFLFFGWLVFNISIKMIECILCWRPNTVNI